MRNIAVTAPYMPDGSSGALEGTRASAASGTTEPRSLTIHRVEVMSLKAD